MGILMLKYLSMREDASDDSVLQKEIIWADLTGAVRLTVGGTAA